MDVWWKFRNRINLLLSTEDDLRLIIVGMRQKKSQNHRVKRRASRANWVIFSKLWHIISERKMLSFSIRFCRLFVSLKRIISNINRGYEARRVTQKLSYIDITVAYTVYLISARIYYRQFIQVSTMCVECQDRLSRLFDSLDNLSGCLLSMYDCLALYVPRYSVQLSR